MAEEVQAADTQQGEPQLPDYSQDTDEQLEARLRGGEGIIKEEIPPEPVVAATPEEETSTVVGKAVAATEEVPAETEPDENEMRIQETELRFKQLEQERDKFEFLTGRKAGEEGFLKQKVDRLEKLLEQSLSKPQEEADPYAERQSSPRQSVPQAGPTEMEVSVTELQQEGRQRALEAELLSFQSRIVKDDGSAYDNQEIYDLSKELEPIIAKHAAPYAGMTLNTKSATKVARLVLDSAYTEHQLGKMQAARVAAQTRRASQVPEKKLAKQVASVAGSGSSPGASSGPKPESAMTAEEADAEMIRLFGDGHSARRR